MKKILPAVAMVLFLAMLTWFIIEMVIIFAEMDHCNELEKNGSYNQSAECHADHSLKLLWCALICLGSIIPLRWHKHLIKKKIVNEDY